MPWLTIVFAVVFAAWALYVSLVEHPARLSIDPVAAVAQFRASYRLAALYQASFANHVGENARHLLVHWGRLHWVPSVLGILAVAVLALRIRLD